MRISLYQQWVTDGRKQWNELRPEHRNAANWHRLHKPGSIPSDDIPAFRALNVPPPFARGKQRGHVYERVKAIVLERDGYTCQACGAQACDVSIVVNHILSPAQGGHDTVENLYACCRRCKSKKPARLKLPARPKTALSGPLAIKLTREQHARIIAEAYDSKLSISEVIRRALDRVPLDASSLPEADALWLQGEAKRLACSLPEVVRRLVGLVHERALARQARDR